MRFQSLFILLFSLTLFAQSNDSIPDNPFIEKMNTRLNVKLDVDNDVEKYFYDNGVQSYTINPNIDYRTELSLNYRFISFSLGFSPHLFSDFNKDLKGETKIFRMSMELYFSKFIQTLEYYQVKGFYASDYTDLSRFEPFGGPNIIILPSLKTFNIIGSTRYKFNENFSLRAITTQTEIQKKSAGTFLPSLTYRYSAFYDKTSPQEISALSFILGAGYLYTLVINKNFYTSIGATPGVGIEFNKLTLKTDNSKITESGNNFTLNLDSHAGIGYNSNRFFGGAYFRLIGTQRSESFILNFDTLRTHYQVFIGYRFGAPKFVKNSVDWLEEKNPF